MATSTLDPPPLRAHLLGPVRLVVGDRALAVDAWPRRASRSLLLLLLATPGHRLPRDQVLDLLWPEAAPAAAANALYVALHGLRRVLEPSLLAGRASAYVEARGDEVRLRSHPGFWVDVAEFEAGLCRAEGAPPAERAALLRSALALYGGDLLADEPYADWPVARREGLRRRWRRAALDAAALGREAGEPLVALPALERLLEADPCDEAGHRALMRSLAGAGRREEALRRYERCLQALRADLGVEPSEATTTLAAAIRAAPRTEPVAAPSPTTRFDNLPAPPTPLVGRARELESLEDLLRDPDVRLVTLTGPGGIGKTRLALEAARVVAEQFSDGLCFAGLASIRDPDLVLPTIGRAFGLEEAGAWPPHDLLRARLRERELLLILDNFEQVIEAAPIVAELLEGCPRLKVLVTSRESLHLRAEHEVRPPPLALPSTSQAGARRWRREAAMRYEAVTLFVQRARAANPDFVLSDDDAGAVVALCLRLDGLPLAIELAAARSRFLAPAELLAGLTDRFALLAAGYRDLPPRQRTMRDAISWSYDLLTPAEQALFRRLAVFVGGCTRDAAERLAAEELALPGGDDAVPDLIASLAEKSLLRLDETDDGPRVVMLETIREYGLEQLQASGEAAAVSEWHADFFVAFAEAAEAALWQAVQGPQQAGWLDRLETEYDNLRAALTWADRHDAAKELRLATALSFFWHERSYFQEGRAWLDRAVQRSHAEPAPLRAKALHGASLLTMELGDYEHGLALGEEGLALYRELGDKEGIGRSVNVLAQAAAELGAWDRAVALGKESLALARELGHTRGIIVSLRHLGAMALQQGDQVRAVALLDEALRLAREHRDRIGTAWVLLDFGNALQAEGDSAAAARAFRESLLLCRDHGGLSELTVCVYRLAWLATAAGQAESATRLFGAGERMRHEIPFALPATERAVHELALAAAHAALGEERFQAAWSAGRALPREEAIAIALQTADALS